MPSLPSEETLFPLGKQLKKANFPYEKLKMAFAEHAI
jgi:hypothetical protein